jgi:type IX secretion system substrate protein
MYSKFTLALLTAFSFSLAVVAQCGPEPTTGTTTPITGTANSYFPGTGNPVTGATSITIGTLDARGSTSPLTANDLILIIQMQGADINSVNADTYGDNVAGGGAQGYLSTNLVAGYHEYANVTAVAGSVVTLQSGLVNSYYTRAFGGGAIQSYQVIRIPRNYNLTISSGVTLSGPYWNGATGGVIVLDAVNVMTIDGTVTATGLGFRGGGGKQLTGVAAGNTNGTGIITNTDFRWNSTFTTPANQTGGSKGEGIAGTPNYVYNPGAPATTNLSIEGYTGGSVGWGAPGNAGGGGTDGQPSANGYNTGGGGGGNGGAGGKGGAGWHGGTGTVASFPTGGYGGAVFSQRQVNRLIMGGGGGAGSANNSATNEHYVSGGSGGGIILLRAGSFAGTTGIVSANGAAARGIVGAPGGAQTDAAGGGGAGGTIVAVTRANVPVGLGGVSASASGGAGGNAEFHFEHGPGGGGGGGVIITNGAFSSSAVAGGPNGLTRLTTTTNPVNSPYGSAPGSAGVLITLAGAPLILNATFGNAACGVLPIQLETFTASANGTAAILEWTVDHAVSFSKFEVQFSTDATSFIPVGDVAFKQTQSKYQFSHSGSTAPVNYYRLRLVDKNGSFTYSKTLAVRTNVTVNHLVLYPQPAKGFTTVQVSALSRQKVNLQVVSASGGRVVEKQVQLSAGNNIFLLDNLGKLSAGIYTVRMTIDGKVQTAKLMVE